MPCATVISWRWQAFAWLVLSLATPVPAAEFDPQVLGELRGTLQRFVDERVVSGAVGVVGSSRGIAVLEAVGAQTLEPVRPMTADSVFRIASMTKPITALAVLQLQDAGRLSVDDPVEKHLPEFRGQRLIASQSADALTLKNPARPITLRDLLTHTSGLPGGYPQGYGDIYFRRSLNLREAILLQSQRPLDFEPGSKWSYCNAGIDALGRVVEVVSGRSYEDYLAQNILNPLGMLETTPFVRADQRVRLAAIYDQKEGQLTESMQPLVGALPEARHSIPAGGLVSTAGDLARLYRCLLKGGELDGQRIIQAATLAEMTKVQTGDLKAGFGDGLGFGFGFAVVREPQGVTAGLSAGSYGHGGAFGTQGWLDPHQDLFFIVLIQRNGLAGGDGSDIRVAVQNLAVRALKK